MDISDLSGSIARVRLSDCTYGVLKITIPESLDYEDVFQELLDAYTTNYKLSEVKTTNMGSLYKLTYNVKLKKDTNVKEFMDKLRCRNGNLEISCSHPVANDYSL